MQQPFCLMDGSVCSCYVHYTGFPSALHPPCLPTFSHLHLGLATLGTLPTLCTHWKLKSIEKNCRAPFQSFQSWAKGSTLDKIMGFLACMDQSKACLFIKPCCGMHNTTWNSQRGIWQSGIWIPLNTSSCEGKWPRAAPAITTMESGVQREHGNLSSELPFFLFISWLMVVNVNWI